jgi:hypothetical protein
MLMPRRAWRQAVSGAGLAVNDFVKFPPASVAFEWKCIIPRLVDEENNSRKPQIGPAIRAHPRYQTQRGHRCIIAAPKLATTVLRWSIITDATSTMFLEVRNYCAVIGCVPFATPDDFDDVLLNRR